MVLIYSETKIPLCNAKLPPPPRTYFIPDGFVGSLLHTCHHHLPSTQHLYYWILAQAVQITSLQELHLHLQHYKD